MFVPHSQFLLKDVLGILVAGLVRGRLCLETGQISLKLANLIVEVSDGFIPFIGDLVFLGVTAKIAK